MKAAIIIVLIIGACHGGWARESFKPWDADVAVGDEALERAGHGAAEQAPGVYDSFTGGALLLIRVFQLWISPLDGPSCRFSPTCSAYGTIAVRKHGALFGGILAGDRILRCNPAAKPGSDPVPDTLFDR
jgi:uncharacterized protein